MADQNHNSAIPTNEDIINDLTKDLQSNCILEGEQPQETSPEHEKCEDAAGEKGGASKSAEEDYIDEEALKDVEASLTSEELEARRQKAAELKTKGNGQFKNELYLECVRTYTDALLLCPLSRSEERSVLYCNRAAGKLKVGRKASAIDDCTKAIELNEKYVRAYLRRAKLYEETDKLDECLEDYKKVLEFDPGQPEARSAVIRLPPIINERNEKLKAEMLGL